MVINRAGHILDIRERDISSYHSKKKNIPVVFGKFGIS
jgi:hypothetical protein